MATKKLYLLCLGIALLAACSKDGGAKTGTEAAPVKPPVAVESLVATPADLQEAVEVTGSLEPKFSADVKTQIPGLVKEVYVTEWVRVRKGTPLARIAVTETEAQVKRAEAGIESAKAGLAQVGVAAMRADRELARMLKLKETGLATQQSVDDARTEAAASSTRIAAAKAQITVAQEELHQAKARLAKGLVTSPLDGVVAVRDVNVGDLASDAAAAKPVFRIVDNRLLNLTVTVPSADSGRVKVGQSLDFTVDSFPGKTFSGKVMYINPELSPQDRSLKVIAEVKNPGEALKGGLFAKGRIVTGTRSKVVQVVRQALGTWDVTTKKAQLFVIENGTAHLRQVETGTVAGDQVEITAGLKPGEAYVARGGFALKEGDKVVVPAVQKQVQTK